MKMEEKTVKENVGGIFHPRLLIFKETQYIFSFIKYAQDIAEQFFLYIRSGSMCVKTLMY